MRYLCAAATVLAFCSFAWSDAEAATATTTFTVTVTIAATCVVSATNLDFGTQGVLAANVDQTSTITVTCTNGTTYNIGLDKGMNGASVTARQMKSGPGALINYSLFSDAPRTTNWGQTIGTDTVPGTGNGVAQPSTVFGRIPPQTSPAPNPYTDTITVTATY